MQHQHFRSISKAKMMAEIDDGEIPSSPPPTKAELPTVNRSFFTVSCQWPVFVPDVYISFDNKMRGRRDIIAFPNPSFPFQVPNSILPLPSSQFHPPFLPHFFQLDILPHLILFPPKNTIFWLCPRGGGAGIFMQPWFVPKTTNAKICF